LTFARLSFVSGQTSGGIFGIFHPQPSYFRSPRHPPDFYDFCIFEEVVSGLFMGSGAHRDAPTSSSGAVGEWKACSGVSMTADVTEEAVPSLFMRLGAHRDAPTSNSGAVGEWKACSGVSMTADVIEEAVPSLFIRLGAHRDAPTSNPGAGGEWKSL
jgi:hypothetical protein